MIETPAQRSHEYLEPCVKVVKIEPKIPPKASKKAPLAVNDRKQGKRTKQNRIFWLRTPIKVRKGDPRGLQNIHPRHLQTLQNASKAPPRGVLEAKTLKIRFLKDVLYGIHGLGRPRTSQTHPKTSEKVRWTLSREPWKPLKEPSETGTRQKSLLSPATIWDIPAFEPWTREMGPQLYIDAQRPTHLHPHIRTHALPHIILYYITTCLHTCGQM